MSIRVSYSHRPATISRIPFPYTRKAVSSTLDDYPDLVGRLKKNLGNKLKS